LNHRPLRILEIRVPRGQRDERPRSCAAEKRMNARRLI
jgi:hypothetical protein